jgi:hypothetical protein
MAKRYFNISTRKLPLGGQSLDPRDGCAKLCLLLFSLVFSTNLSGQNAEIIDIQESICTFSGTSKPRQIYSFASSGEALQIIQEIVANVGATPTFEIRASGEVGNAAATVLRESDGRNKRYILYNQDFIQQINKRLGSPWAAKSILAHELGHHINGHTLNRYDTITAAGILTNHKEELDADFFSGHALAQMGASLDEAQLVMKNLAEVAGSKTHPPRSARLQAISVGWTQWIERNKVTSADEQVANPPQTVRLPAVKNKSGAAASVINFIYQGSPIGLEHLANINIKIGDVNYHPIENHFSMENILLGRANYNVTGTISLALMNLLGMNIPITVTGSGVINIEEGATYNVWLGMNIFTDEYFFYIE